MPFRVVGKKIHTVHLIHKCNDGSTQLLQSEPLSIVQDDGFAAVPVFAYIYTAHICTASVFDAGGYINTVSAAINCNATTNLQDLSTAK